MKYFIRREHRGGRTGQAFLFIKSIQQLNKIYKYYYYYYYILYEIIRHLGNIKFNQTITFNQNLFSLLYTAKYSAFKPFQVFLPNVANEEAGIAQDANINLLGRTDGFPKDAVMNTSSF